MGTVIRLKEAIDTYGFSSIVPTTKKTIKVQ